MLFEELLRDERNEGRAEGRLEGRLEIIFELLEDIGPIPEDWKEKISRETDPEVLKKYVKLARRAESVEDFIQAVQNQ
ncbi:MAG: hypothetical protein Q4F21_01350 [Lachnospiraceae bacterium]|nr:hypothetical protein [Lachnospiraceae bacterium]